MLCGFPLNGHPYINIILDYSAILLAEGVVNEILAAQRGKIARVVSPLLKNNDMTILSVSDTPAILDTAYDKLLGIGERSTIKAALDNGITPVIDDKDAFIVACRFGLHPIGFQDFIIQLAIRYGMSKQTAIEIVQTTARQFPAAFLNHTLNMLS